MNPKAKRTLVIGSIILLPILIGGIYYFYAMFKLAVLSDQRGLFLASLLRKEIAGLREPTYSPVQASENRVRNPNDIPLISVSYGSQGGCKYATLQPCQAFAVSAQILNRAETLSALLRYMDHPCPRVSASGAGAPKTESSSKKIAESKRELEAPGALSYFGCKDGKHEFRTVILNVVDSLDQPAAERSVRYQIIRTYN